MSDTLFREALAELEQEHFWIAFNTFTYQFDSADMWFFRSEDEANRFASDNVSDVDSYDVLYAASLRSLMEQVGCGEDFIQRLREVENRLVHPDRGPEQSKREADHTLSNGVKRDRIDKKQRRKGI